MVNRQVTSITRKVKVTNGHHLTKENGAQSSDSGMEDDLLETGKSQRGQPSGKQTRSKSLPQKDWSLVPVPIAGDSINAAAANKKFRFSQPEVYLNDFEKNDVTLLPSETKRLKITYSEHPTNHNPRFSNLPFIRFVESDSGPNDNKDSVQNQENQEKVSLSQDTHSPEEETVQEETPPCLQPATPSSSSICQSQPSPKSAAESSETSEEPGAELEPEPLPPRPTMLWCKHCEMTFDRLKFLKAHIQVTHGKDVSRLTWYNSWTYDIPMVGNLVPPAAWCVDESDEE